MKNPQIRFTSLREAMEALADRRTTAAALTRHALARVQACEELVNGFATADWDGALLAAAESDRRYAEGSYRYLEGLPIGVEDRADPGVVQMLREQGAIALGFGSGAAAAIGQGAVATCLATAAGGPVRIPAALRGVVGFKPTRDAHPGLLGNAVDDVILLAGGMQLGAPWQDIPPHSRFGIVHGMSPMWPSQGIVAVIEGALAKLRRHYTCRSLEPRAVPDGVREAFALGDRAGAPVDYLALPIYPRLASSLAEETPLDVAGFPAISLPVCLPGSALPAALQIIGKPGEDGELLQIAEQIERLLIGEASTAG